MMSSFKDGVIRKVDVSLSSASGLCSYAQYFGELEYERNTTGAVLAASRSHSIREEP